MGFISQLSLAINLYCVLLFSLKCLVIMRVPNYFEGIKIGVRG